MLNIENCLDCSNVTLKFSSKADDGSQVGMKWDISAFFEDVFLGNFQVFAFNSAGKGFTLETSEFEVHSCSVVPTLLREGIIEEEESHIIMPHINTIDEWGIVSSKVVEYFQTGKFDE